MASAKMKHNTAAWRLLRLSDQVQNDLLRRAEAGKEAADKWLGETGFKVVKEAGKNRARYTVRPATYLATAKVAKDPVGFANVVLNAGKGDA